MNTFRTLFSSQFDGALRRIERARSNSGKAASTFRSAMYVPAMNNTGPTISLCRGGSDFSRISNAQPAYLRANAQLLCSACIFAMFRICLAVDNDRGPSTLSYMLADNLKYLIARRGSPFSSYNVPMFARHEAVS